MKLRYLSHITFAATMMLLVTFASIVSAQDKAKAAADAAVAQENLAYAVGVQAYLYGQPLIDGGLNRSMQHMRSVFLE